MNGQESLSAMEVADILGVSKNTIYNLTERGELASFRVGRKIRFSPEDVQEYIARSKGSRSTNIQIGIQTPQMEYTAAYHKRDFIICGQDVILDVLSNYLRQRDVPALRAYIGSYDGLVSLYRDQVSVTASHMWDADSDEYNIPYVRRLLPGVPTIIVALTTRIQGFYVAKGNPKGIKDWKDFLREDITMVNREQGAGSRVLLDENLRRLGISGDSIKGYSREISSHLAVASAISSGEADVAIGSEKIARQVDNIDFIPMKKEYYDLVFKKKNLETYEIRCLLDIIRSSSFKNEFANIGGYDTSEMGKIRAEL